MRKSVLAPLLSLALLGATVGGYAVADIYDLAPGILTLKAPASSVALQSKEILAPRTPEFADNLALNPQAPLPAPDQVARYVEASVNQAQSTGWEANIYIVDALSGKELGSHQPRALSRPASVSKLVAAAAALQTLGPEYRFTTSTYLTGDSLYLTGDGDQLLSLQPQDKTPAASLYTLAQNTAAALRAQGRTGITLRVDPRGFTSEIEHTSWNKKGNRAYAGEIVPLAINEGRVGEYKYSYEPQVLARTLETFSQLLKEAGVQVEIAPEQTAPKSPSQPATVLAEAKSEPLYRIVNEMLLESDNTLAETLCRAAALHAGKPGTFAGQMENNKRVLQDLGLDPQLYQNVDCSGLSEDNRLAPKLLVDLLRKTVDAKYPRLRPLLEGLPVSGFTGTLRNAYNGPLNRGRIIAKTGLLSNARSLAGFALTPEGRTLAFAVIAYGENEAGAGGGKAAIREIVNGITGANDAE